MRDTFRYAPVVAVVLLLAGCGGDGTSKTDCAAARMAVSQSLPGAAVPEDCD